MAESSIFADLETIKTNMIKLQKRNEELEEENAKLKAGTWENKESGLFYRDLKSENEMVTTLQREADEEIKRLKIAAARLKKTIVERNATIDALRENLEHLIECSDEFDRRLAMIGEAEGSGIGLSAYALIHRAIYTARAALEPKRAEADIVGKEEEHESSSCDV